MVDSVVCAYLHAHCYLLGIDGLSSAARCSQAGWNQIECVKQGRMQSGKVGQTPCCAAVVSVRGDMPEWRHILKRME